MRYLITTTHRPPRFYKTDGTTVCVDLRYVENKTISSINEKGELSHLQIAGTPPCVGNVWLVDSVEESLRRLSEQGVHPYINKAAAKANAKKLGLESFKYIAVS